MNKIKTFEDLTVWQESLQLTIDMYKALVNCKDFGLKGQLCRSCVSIPSNIAEGFERNSNKEFIRFLRIAKASSGELRTQLYIATSIGIIDKQLGNKFLDKSLHISSMLQNLIKTRLSKF